MAGKISELTDAAPAVGTDEVEIKRGSGNLRLALSAVAAYVNGLLTATLAALAPLASPTFTGTPAGPTAAPGTNTTQLATTAFVEAVRLLLAPLASPALTGNPTAPTQTQGDRSTKLATTQFVAQNGCMVLGIGGVAPPLTGSTSETALKSILVPAGALGPNGHLRMWAFFEHTNDASVKSVRFRISTTAGAGGSAVLVVAVTSQAVSILERTLVNQNAQNVQAAWPAGTTAPDGVTTTALSAWALDFSVDQYVNITGLLTDAADTITLKGWRVEGFYGA
jgi:hypothetical protein